MTLLIVFGGGSEEECRTLLDTVNGIAKKGRQVTLLLVHEACRSAVDKAFCEDAMRIGVDLYALREDLEAQGLLDQVAEGVETVGYDGWVRLLEGCGSVFSWI